MKITKKILLSSLTIFTLSGCGGGGSSSSIGDIGTENPLTPDNPVVVTPEPTEPTPPVVLDPIEPTEPTDPIEPKPPVDPYKPAGWYGKTKVSATDINGKVYSHTTAGVFGELVQSTEAKDQHDIPGYGSAIFQVVFPQTEWEDDNGDYFSNYKNYDENSIDKRVWTFQIKNQHTVNLAAASISINLDGVFDVKYKEENGRVEYKESQEVNQTIINELHLIDVDNATEYTVAELKTANLTMEGLHTRTFRWVLGIIDQDDYTPLAKTTVASAKMSVASSDDESENTNTDDFTLKTSIQTTGGKFGLPPQ